MEAADWRWPAATTVLGYLRGGPLSSDVRRGGVARRNRAARRSCRGSRRILSQGGQHHRTPLSLESPDPGLYCSGSTNYRREAMPRCSLATRACRSWQYAWSVVAARWLGHPMWDPTGVRNRSSTGLVTSDYGVRRFAGSRIEARDDPTVNWVARRCINAGHGRIRKIADPSGSVSSIVEGNLELQSPPEDIYDFCLTVRR